MSSQVIDGWKPIRGVPGKTIVTQNSDGSYTVTIDPSAIGDGSGDMLKAVYDIDGNDIVDAAESVPWGGVTGKPLVFPPDAHTHSGSDVTSQVSSAASADSVPWAGVTDKPLVFPPDAHTHDDRYYTESEIGALLGGYVLKSTFDANSLLIANTDDTPTALTVGASTIVGRGASGGIAALSASDARTVLGLATTDAPTFAGVVTAYVAPASDSTTALQVRKADKSTAVLNVDTTNSRVGINNTSSVLTFAVSSSSPKFGFYDTTVSLSADQMTAFSVEQNQIGEFGVASSNNGMLYVKGVGTGAAGSSIGIYNEGFVENSPTTYAVHYFNASTRSGTSLAAISDAGAIFKVANNRSAKFTILGSGNVGIGTTLPTISDGVGVDINGKILRLRSSKTPASASDTGNVGEICWDANYVNVAVGTNTWKKTPLVSAFAANSIIYADTSGNPANLTVGASTIIGRAASGDIAALSASDARTVLGLATTDTVQFAKIGVGIAPNFNLIFTTESSSVKSWLGGLGSDVYDAVAGFQYAGTTSQAEFLGIRSRGTIASPTATQSGDSLFMLSGKGYQGTAYTSRRAYIRIVAEENYSSSAQGAGFAFATTAPGGTTRSEKIVFTGAGNVGIGTTSPTISDGVGVDIAGKILRLRSSKTPASASDTGNVGEICWDSGAIYVCVATDTWKKATLATW